MAKVSGFGGYIVVSGSPNAIFHLASYDFDVEVEIDDTTTSANSTVAGGTGFDEGLGTAKHFNGATLRFPEDDSNYPEAFGLTEGTVLTIWFRRGADAVYDQVVNTIVKSSRPTNDQKKARVWEIQTQYGSFSRNVTAPTL